MSATCLLCTFSQLEKEDVCVLWKKLQCDSCIMLRNMLGGNIRSVRPPSIFLLWTPPPPSSTGHHTKVLNAWIRLITVAHILADFFRLSGFPVFNSAWAKVATLAFVLQKCARTAQLCGEAARTATAKAAISAIFLLLSADSLTLPITTLGLIVTGCFW